MNIDDTLEVEEGIFKITVVVVVVVVVIVAVVGDRDRFRRLSAYLYYIRISFAYMKGQTNVYV